jgi:hypothetical protein
MSIKRHPALQPFSRDHLIGLFHAQRLIKSNAQTDAVLRKTVQEFSDAYQREISIHFADEDRIIGPLAISAENLTRLHNEHIELTALIEKLLDSPAHELASKVGTLLDAHIRWEEHELFPEVESLPEQQLLLVAEQTAEIERSRKRRLL